MPLSRYLNQNWDRRAGGELAIFEPEKGELGDEQVEGKLTWLLGTHFLSFLDTFIHIYSE